MADFPIKVIINPTAAVAGARRIKAELTGIQTKASGVGKLMNRVFAFAGLGFGLNQIRKFSDSFIELQNRLRVAGFETEQLNDASAKLIEISNRTRSPLEANAKLLGRIGIASNDLGASQEDMFRVIELVGKGLAIQGSSAQEARGAIIQLSQAFGSGTVRAEEFNSVAEGAAPILQAVAKSMGVTFSELKKLVAAGKVASVDFFEALIDGGTSLDELFEKVTPTIGQAFTVLSNQLIALTGTLEQNFGALSFVANGMLLIANSLDIVIPLLIDAALAFAALKLSIFVGTFSSLAVEVRTFTGAISLLAATFPRAAAGAGLLSGAMAILAANPLIAGAILLVGAVALMIQFGDAINLTSDGTVTLASAAGALANLVGGTLSIVFQGLVIILQFLAQVLLAVAQGLIIIAGAIVNAFGKLFEILGPLTPLFIAIGAAVFGFIGAWGIFAAAVLTVVIALTDFKDEIIEMFPILQDVFNFMSEALRIAVALWKGFVIIVKDAATALGLFEGKTIAAASALKAAGTGAGGFGTEAAKATNKVNALSDAGRSIGPAFASGTNQAIGGLNNLSSAAATTANSIISNMNAAARASASAGGGGGGGRGLVGTGTGTSINTGGSGKLTVSAPSAIRAEAQARGGRVQASTSILGGGPTGGAFFGLRISFKVVDTKDFAGEAREKLIRQAIASSGEAPNRQLLAVIDRLAKLQGARTLADRLAAAGVGGGGLGGGRGDKDEIAKLVAEAQALKEFTNLTSATKALTAATFKLEDTVAKSNLDPIFLTGNPFEAFRQNVFGFNNATGFATGGVFDVPGSGGKDSKRINLDLTPGERVTIKTRAQQREDERERRVTIVQNITYKIDTPDADSFRASQTQIVARTVNQLARVANRI